MEIRAVGFDIGHTLVGYEHPLNWKALYEPALRAVLQACGFPVCEESLERAADILAKYNTREHPRVHEVGSEVIFREIFDAWAQPYGKIFLARETFYGFFQAGAACYTDADAVLRFLKMHKIRIGALTDVAYGMDNAFSLRDIAPIRQYFDIVLTSVDVGFRKPHEAGYERLLQAFGTSPGQTLYVGDEEKDIVGANALGIVSVLVDRACKKPDWGQRFTVHSLLDIRLLL